MTPRTARTAMRECDADCAGLSGRVLLRVKVPMDRPVSNLCQRLGTLAADLALDQFADAVAERVVAHGADVPGGHVAREDAAQPRAALGGPLELDRKDPRLAARRVCDGAVGEVQAWMACRG